MRILPRWSDEERFIESRGREIERPPSWRDGWTERESEREGGGRLTRCVWAVSLRHQLDGRSKECAHACTRCRERVCALHAPTRIVHCVPLEPVASQRWPSPRRDEERRGEAKRGEARRGEVGKRQKRRGRPTARTRTLALSCFGPATINERRAKIVLCFHPPILSSPPISALHLPVRRLAFTGMGSIRRLSGFLRAGQDLSINILEPIRGNRGANLMPKEMVSDDSLYR